MGDCLCRRLTGSGQKPFGGTVAQAAGKFLKRIFIERIQDLAILIGNMVPSQGFIRIG